MKIRICNKRVSEFWRDRIGKKKRCELYRQLKRREKISKKEKREIIFRKENIKQAEMFQKKKDKPIKIIISSSVHSVPSN